MIRDFYLTHIPIQLNAVIGGIFYIKKRNVLFVNLISLPLLGNFIYKTTKDYFHLLIINKKHLYYNLKILLLGYN